MNEKLVQIKQEFGLNARLSALVSLWAKNFNSNILIIKEQKEFDAKSIMAAIMTSAVQGDWLMVRAEGPDEDEAVNEIVSILQIQSIQKIEQELAKIKSPMHCQTDLKQQTDEIGVEKTFEANRPDSPGVKRPKYEGELNQFEHRIVAIDDDSTTLELYKRLFEKTYNAMVVTTTDPEKALNFALQNPPDLFISDLVHPGMSGISLIKKLREQEKTKLVPICIISGQAKTKEGRMASEVGADLVFSKPFQTDEFIDQFNRLFRIEKWIRFILNAFHNLGEEPLPSLRSLLVKELHEGKVGNEEKKIFQETVGVVTSMFFKMASKGKTFCSLNRIKESFGFTLEENYGITSGPFINMARTYWTFQIEVDDLFPEHKNILLWQILYYVEKNIRSLFFPTPGPFQISVKKRRKTQREILQRFVPEIDVEEFISNNPVLLRESRTSHFWGKLILAIFIIGLLFVLFKVVFGQ